MEIISWIRSNAPVSFDLSNDVLRAYTLIGGQAAEIQLPPEFTMKDDDPAVLYCRRLLNDGPMPTALFNERMKAAGFSRRQVKSAKQYLGLVSSPEGFRSKWTTFYREQ